MNWAKIIAFLALSVVAVAQTQPPPPQTARQAVLEMFFSKLPKAFERHLPENAMATFGKTDSGLISMFNAQVASIQQQVMNGRQHVETFEAGPLLLVSDTSEGNHQQRIEVAVDRDDLSGDQDQIELSLHVYKDGVIDRMPVLPNLILDMREEKNIWRLSEITLAVHVPLSDPDYVKGIAEDMRKTHQRMAEYQAIASLRAMRAAETAHQKTSSGGYICNIADLGRGLDVAGAAELGLKPSYVYKITDCSSSSFHITAEPAKDGPARRALCIDESGTPRFSEDAKGSTCISSGKSIDELEKDNGGGVMVGFHNID